MTIKAFVTGGTGFVGGNLVRLLLEKGYEVKALARSGSQLDNLKDLDLEIVTGDLQDPELWPQMQGCDVLFHVAAHYSLRQSDRLQLHASNVLGTRQILATARKAQIPRSIYTSSVAAIGVKVGGIADESYQSPIEKLVGAYKKSKYLAEQEAVKAFASGQDVLIVNPSTPVGGWDIKPTPTGGEIILRFLKKQMPAYLDTGLNLIHVRDVAEGHILAYENGKSGDRYILGNQNMTLKAVLEQLSTITGLSAPKISVPYWLPYTVAWVDEKILPIFGKTPSVPLDGVRMSRQPMYYNAAKAVQELGLPQTAIATALKDAVDWFETNGYVTN